MLINFDLIPMELVNDKKKKKKKKPSITNHSH
jgi:hypothetical protein